jgi:hypothetical protein
MGREPSIYSEEDRMKIFQDLENASKAIDHDVKQIGAEIDKDLQKAIDAVKSGIVNVEALVAKGFADAEQAIIRGVAEAAKTKYADDIAKLRALSNLGITSADPQSIIDDLVAAFQHADGNAAGAVLSNLVTAPMKNAFAGLSTFDTLTLSADSEVDLGFGVAASLGGGIRMTSLDVGHARMMMDFGESAGAEEGADIGLALGMWAGPPKDQQGGYIACTLGADDGVGANVIVFMSMTWPPAFSGIVLDLTAGEEVEFSIDCGYTLTFKVPPGAVL